MPHERDRLLDAVIEAMTLLKERRVDRMIRERQEQLLTITDEAELLTVLAGILELNEVKKLLAKQTGRVVVG